MPAGIALAMQLLFGLLDRATQIKQLMETAKAEGRDISDAEIQQFLAEDDAARQRLVDSINRANANQGSSG